MTNPLKSIKKQSMFAVTGSEPLLLKATMDYAKEHNTHCLVEATVNQVNQFGGYTGMKPKDYADMMQEMAKDTGFPVEKLILCGDHLGPFVWQHLPEKEAMENSKELVRQYVAAGFRKIHLDPTMRLQDDDPNQPLSNEIIAERTAELAAVSEATYEATKKDTPWQFRPAYVLGSEVPVPGGTEEEHGMQVTTPQDLSASLSCFEKALTEAGLKIVWDDVVAVVAQIGVEFSDETVHDFNADAATSLVAGLKTNYPHLYFESHSSDYQTSACLRDMVQSRVGILKVGPGVTFALREGLFALAMMENELKDMVELEPSNFIDVLDNVMQKHTPNYWKNYYHGNKAQQAFKRRYSYSDRSRYYLAQPEVRKAMTQLLDNLDNVAIPLPLISQYMPQQYDKIRDGALKCSATNLLFDKMYLVLDKYHKAIAEGS